MANLKKRALPYLLTAGGMVLILCAVYALCGYWPFGPNSVMTGDLNSQYIPFYAHFYDAARAGGSLVYAGDMGLGGGSFALFAYYFASPFAWVYLLFAPEAYGWLCCVVWALKITLASLTFVWYLRRHWGPCALFVPLAWCYGLMGYAVAYAQNVLWLDSVILLPVVAAGLDALLRGRRGLCFTLALAAAIFTNFYMGYMLCIFSVLYILAMLAATPLPGGRKQALARFGQFVLCGVGAAALAGAVLLPALEQILGVKNTALELTGGVQFNLLDLVQKFFTGNFVWADVQNGLPPVYCGMLGLAGLLLYIVSPRPGREKGVFLALAAVLALSLWWQPLDLVWHGFAAPNWFPYRESFLLVFWLLTLGAGALTAPFTRCRAFTAGGLALVLAAVVFLTRAETYGRRRWALACVLLLAAMALVWLWSRSAGTQRRLCAGALAVLAAGELALNAAWALRQFEVYPVADYETFVSDGRATVQAVEAQNPDRLRTEKTFFRTLNDPMLLGFDGLTHFSSVQDGTGTLLLMALGYCNYGASYGYLGGSTAAADSLLSIGYYLDRDGGTVPTHFTKTDLDTPWQVYENANALPRALWSPGEAGDFSLTDVSDPFTAAERLYAALLGQETPLFTRLEGGAGSSFTLTPGTDGILYAVFTGTAADVPLTVNGTDAGTVLSVERSSGAVIDLGRVNAGDTVTLTLGAEVDSAAFAVLDEAALANACTALTDAAPAVTEWRDGAVTLQTDQTTDGLAVLTMPYDENWRAELDGRPVEVQAAGYLLGVDVPAGAHTLTLTYTQPGAAAGLVLSAAGLLGLLTAAVLFRRRNRS
nr:YfhO family protein [uncultured Gemmiger sp.]